MDQILDAIAKAPVAAKVGVVAAIVVLLTALNYFVFSIPTFGSSISEIEQRIARTDAEQERLDNDLIEKTAIANNLNQFRREKELLEQRLQEALAELPEEKKIDELLQLFQERARKAGLEISTIEPQRRGERGLLRPRPHQHGGHRELPRDRHLLRLAGAPAPHREREQHPARHAQGHRRQGDPERQVPGHHLHVRPAQGRAAKPGAAGGSQ